MKRNLGTIKLGLRASVFAAPFLLVGCSSVPDAVNPVVWYDSTMELFEGDEQAAAEGTVIASSDALNTAPRGEVAEGFRAPSTSSRKYAEPVMVQGEVVNPLGETMVARSATGVANAGATSQTAQEAALERIRLAKQRADQYEASKGVQNTPTATVTAPATQDSAISVAQDTPRFNIPSDQPATVESVYARHISQTRPDNPGAVMNGVDSAYENFNGFQTVVVSGGGVTHQSPAYMMQETQYGAAYPQHPQIRNAVGDGHVLPIDPAVVRAGHAMSLTQYNPTMFSNSFQVATIQFGNGSAQLSAHDRRILQEVMNIHRQQGGVIRVVGHASSRTQNMPITQHRQVNQTVSIGRADQVARELLKMGVSSQTLYVGGVSDSQPLYQEVMPSGEAGNRRTEIYIDY